MKRMLITGGAGFLGSHLCDRLIKDDHDILCVDNFFTGSKTNIAHLMGLYLDELANNPAQSARVRLVQLITEDIKQAPKAAQSLIKAIENGELAVDIEPDVGKATQSTLSLWERVRVRVLQRSLYQLWLL